MKNRWLIAVLVFGVISSLYGAAKASIALHLHLFSRDFAALVRIGNGQGIAFEQRFLELATQLLRLAQELALSEALACFSSFALFVIALVLAVAAQKRENKS
jgi:hypothetical protein